MSWVRTEMQKLIVNMKNLKQNSPVTITPHPPPVYLTTLSLHVINEDLEESSSASCIVSYHHKVPRR